MTPWSPSAAMSPTGLRFENIHKRYGGLYAVRGVTLEIAPGECAVLAGRNGSGKTTLLRLASQLVRPSAGAISFPGWQGKEPRQERPGFVAHATMVYDELTAEENLLLFAKLQNQRDLFDAGEKGLRGLLKAANAPATGSIQDQLMDLLAGTKPAGNAALEDAHEQMLRQMSQVFEAQRLVSLDTIFGLSERLESAASGQKLDLAAAAKLAGRITEIQLPRTALSTRERTEMSAGYWTDKHIEAERKLNLRAAIDKAGTDPQKLRDARGGLAPVLRDTLVGLNYVHYAPPGAQVLFTNPAFVRNHDFIGNPERQRTWQGTEVAGSGWPTNAGGRLTGSLIALPYA